VDVGVASDSELIHVGQFSDNGTAEIELNRIVADHGWKDRLKMADRSLHVQIVSWSFPCFVTCLAQGKV
jgi:hypothetical protein